jgi:hypothetical protein
MPTIALVGAATDEVIVVADAAIGIWVAVMPDRPVPPAVIALCTKASVARSVEVSAVAWVVAVAPLGSAGVPLKFAAVPVVF